MKRSIDQKQNRDKTVYKHSFLFGRRRATWKNIAYTHFLLRNKFVFIPCFSALPEMRHCSSLRSPFLMYSLLFPHVAAVAVLCVRIEGGCGTTWRPKPKSNTNKKTVFKHIFHATTKTQYLLNCRSGPHRPPIEVL